MYKRFDLGAGDKRKENEEKLVMLFMLQYTNSEIAGMFSIVEASLKRFLNRRENALLKERCDQARLWGNAQVRLALFSKAKAGDMTAIRYWQENFDREHVVNKDGDLPPEDLGRKSDDQLTEMILTAFDDIDLKKLDEQSRKKLVAFQPKQTAEGNIDVRESTGAGSGAKSTTRENHPGNLFDQFTSGAG